MKSIGMKYTEMKNSETKDSEMKSLRVANSGYHLTITSLIIMSNYIIEKYPKAS